MREIRPPQPEGERTWSQILGDGRYFQCGQEALKEPLVQLMQPLRLATMGAF
jgi:hypothetical protein